MVTTETSDNSYKQQTPFTMVTRNMDVNTSSYNKTDFSGTTMTAYNCYNNGCLDWCYLSHLLPLTEIIALILVFEGDSYSNII